MPDMVFFIGIGMLLMGAFVLIAEAFKYYVSRSDLYSQERYDAAFRKIVRREMRLEKQRARNERLRESVDGIQ